MIKIIPFEPWHLELIDVQEEQRYLYEYYQQVGITPEQYGDILIATAIKENGNPCAWSYYKDGEILGCGGIAQTNLPHIAEAWCIFGKDFKLCFKTAVKRIREAVELCDHLRIQAFTETDFISAQRFLEFLGFQKEGILKRQGIDTRDNIIYSIIRD